MVEIIRRLVPAKSLRFNTLTRQRKRGRGIVFFRYDNLADVFFIMFVSPSVETTVHYIDDNIGLLYVADTKEVVGMQIEGFAKSFLAKHPQLSISWTHRFVNDNFGDAISQMNANKLRIISQVYDATESTINKENIELTQLFKDNLQTSSVAVL